MSNEDYKQHYSDARFWQKTKHYARSAGEAVLVNGLKMYYAARDDHTPAWAKAALYSGLGYFIFPIDAVPDPLPIVGFSDDLAVLVAAAATTAAYITQVHVDQAKETIKKWFPQSR